MAIHGFHGYPRRAKLVIFQVWDALPHPGIPKSPVSRLYLMIRVMGDKTWGYEAILQVRGAALRAAAQWRLDLESLPPALQSVASLRELLGKMGQQCAHTADPASLQCGDRVKVHWWPDDTLYLGTVRELLQEGAVRIEFDGLGGVADFWERDVQVHDSDADLDLLSTSCGAGNTAGIACDVATFESCAEEDTAKTPAGFTMQIDDANL